MSRRKQPGSMRPGRREGTWELRVSAGHDPARPGRYRYVSRTVGPCSERAAGVLLAELVTEVERGQHAGAPASTFAELLEEWLASATVAGRSPTTLAEYRRLIDRRLVPALGDVPLGKLSVRAFDRFYAELTAEGLSPASIGQIHAVARRACAQGVTWGWLQSNPTRGTTRPSMRRARVSPPSVPMLARIIAAAEETDETAATLFAVAAAIGARRGELCGLQWGDVDLEAGTVRIVRAVALTPAGPIVKGTKTHAERTVDLGRTVAGALVELRRAIEERARWAGVHLTSSSFVFSRDPAGVVPLNPDAVTSAFRRAVAAVHAADVELAEEEGRPAPPAPRVRLHDLRHLSATLQLAAGVPLHTVAERLGHAQVSTTLDVYGHAMPGSGRAAADTLDELLGGQRPPELEP